MNKLEVLYEDNHIIVVEKKPNVPSQADKTGDVDMLTIIKKYIKEKYKDSLVIFTTHNTNLMSNKIMRPDTLFILSTSGKLTPLCKATDRELREGHNLGKLYMNGEFDED